MPEELGQKNAYKSWRKVTSRHEVKERVKRDLALEGFIPTVSRTWIDEDGIHMFQTYCEGRRGRNFDLILEWDDDINGCTAYYADKNYRERSSLFTYSHKIYKASPEEAWCKYYPDRDTFRKMRAYEGCVALGKIGLALDWVRGIRWLELD